MIDLSKAILPRDIEVNDKAYPIHTDYRFWIGFASLAESEKNPYSFDFLYIDEKPEDRIEGFKKLVEFYNPLSPLPRKTTDEGNEKVLDYKLDADYIYAAFMQCYGLDLVDVKELHWHKFLALIKGLSKTRLNDIMGYRSWRKTKRTYEQDMMSLKTAWKIEEEEKLTPEEEAQIDAFLSQLKRPEKKENKDS